MVLTLYFLMNNCSKVSLQIKLICLRVKKLLFVALAIFVADFDVAFGV